jgi:hypothetical protein
MPPRSPVHCRPRDPKSIRAPHRAFRATYFLLRRASCCTAAATCAARPAVGRDAPYPAPGLTTRIIRVTLIDLPTACASSPAAHSVSVLCNTGNITHRQRQCLLPPPQTFCRRVARSGPPGPASASRCRPAVGAARHQGTATVNGIRRTRSRRALQADTPARLERRGDKGQMSA